MARKKRIPLAARPPWAPPSSAASDAAKTARKRVAKAARSPNTLVYIGASGLFAISGYQVYKDKSDAAVVTAMTGLGVLGVGAQNQLGQRVLAQTNGHLIDIRNDPNMPGTPVQQQPGQFDPRRYQPQPPRTYKPGSDDGGPPPPPS